MSRKKKEKSSEFFKRHANNVESIYDMTEKMLLDLVPTFPDYTNQNNCEMNEIIATLENALRELRIAANDLNSMHDYAVENERFIRF